MIFKSKPKQNGTRPEEEFSVEDLIEEETIVDLALTQKRADKKRLDILSLFVLGSGALGLANLLLLLLALVILGKVANRPPPTLVELSSGKSITTAPIGAKDRTKEAIQIFVAETLTSLFDWRGLMPPTNPQETTMVPDPGVDIGGKRVTYSTWSTAFGIHESWRNEFLKTIAEMTPQNLFGGDTRTQAVLVIREMGNPIKTAEGQWQVDVVSDLLVFENGSNLARQIQFNKKVTVLAVEIPLFSKDPSQLQTVIYNARKSGMVIQYMEDLKL
jgi:hypothetical protein